VLKLDGIQARDAARRTQRTQALVENVTGHFMQLMLEQRTRSQAMLERVFGLRVSGCDAVVVCG
jgi:hypothetical protein